MRIIFLGSGDFGLATIQELHHSEHEVVLAILRPDRPVGRGRKLKPTAIKVWCEEAGLPIYQPEKINDEVVEYVRPFGADIFVVVSYGQILPASFFNIPSQRSINVHASLLPRWRGAAPIEYALLHGDSESGLSVQYIEKKLDSGDVFDRLHIPIDIEENAITLREKMLVQAGPFLVSVLDQIEHHSLEASPQDLSAVTHCRQIEKEQGHLDWNQPAADVVNHYRAFYRWPGSFTFFRGKRLKIIDIDYYLKPGDGPIGTIAEVGKDYIDIQCVDGRVRLFTVQPENKRAQDLHAFINGYHPKVGEMMA